MEEVVALEGDSLVIEVTLTEGHAVLRRWRQTQTDPRAAVGPSPVESLCEYQGETCVVLANDGNADLARMYAGLIVTPDAPATTSEQRMSFFRLMS